VVVAVRHDISIPDGSTARSYVSVVVEEFEFLVLNDIDCRERESPRGNGVSDICAERWQRRWWT
jgi:hypothetical protein